ncbi:MAG: class I SAM-dependent methyltransferase [Rhizobiaceae bacterium]|nr:class I SAM-dependent methyltransferase [Rhizobiaceae bacterium]MCV0406275.1 class I SAM-dependent methyltransferase [Rhizobiaceae bacterium]
MSLTETISHAEVARNPYLDRTSIEFRFRARRFAEIKRLISAILDEKGHAEILDLGGTETYWLAGGDFIKSNRHRLSITMVNPEEQSVDDRDLFTFEMGNATDPELFGDRRFDLVHSNSVIEHVGQVEDMKRFAMNVRRLAPRYYVQTPNYWFPYEPHFRVPGFQYLPEFVRARLLTRFSLGFFDRIERLEEAQDIVTHHRLVSTRQMRRFFPGARVFHEKVFGLNKSIIAVRDSLA